MGFSLAVLTAASGLAALPGCGGQRKDLKTPLTVVRDENLNPVTRMRAVPNAVAEASQDPWKLNATKRALLDIAGNPTQDGRLRVGAFEGLLDDTDEATFNAGRELASKVLADERDETVVGFLSERAAQWPEAAPALVRSLSRELPKWKGDGRPELDALTAIGQGRGPGPVVADVLAMPTAELEKTLGTDGAKLVRAEAWGVLASLDPDGSLRQSTVSRLPNGDPATDAVRTAATVMGSYPAGGDELSWLVRVLDASNGQNAAWWRESEPTLSRLRAEGKGPLELRHVEPIRWAAVHRAQWLSASREELLSQLRARIDQRSVRARSGGELKAESKEMLYQRENELTWADVLSALVIDDAVRQPQIHAAILGQAKVDLVDERAALGGALAFRGVNGDESAATIFLPRAGQRRGNEKFFATRDLVLGSDRALAHYRLNAEKAKNSTEAGPSVADLAYAARSRRNCVVFTPLGDGEVGVDYYQPNGAVVDLGSLTLTK